MIKHYKRKSSENHYKLAKVIKTDEKWIFTNFYRVKNPFFPEKTFLRGDVMSFVNYDSLQNYLSANRWEEVK